MESYKRVLNDAMQRLIEQDKANEEEEKINPNASNWSAPESVVFVIKHKRAPMRRIVRPENQQAQRTDRR